MESNALLNWLMARAGPVIRYRTARELCPDSRRYDLQRLADDLVRAPLVRTWLARLGSRGLHGSSNTAVENVLYKLGDLGLHAGMPTLDEKTRPLRESLRKEPSSAPFGIFYRTLVAAGLARLGYADEAIRTCILQRLATLYEWARQGSYDVHLGRKDLFEIRRAYHDKPVLKDEILAEGDLRLPWIHDVYALAALLVDRPAAAADGKIRTVVQYILRPEYQALPEGYGYLRAGTRYYAIGWSVHLPGYDGFDRMPAGASKNLVQRLELMAHFPVARRSEWFRGAIDHLERFRTDNGSYRFPSGYLREQSSGYYVTGAYMRLEADRRRALALECDSTFRVLRIRHLAGPA